MGEPPLIHGGAGSRIRVLLGDNGSEFLVLLNHDTGDAQWQESDWCGMPSYLTKQASNCERKERRIKSIGFDPRTGAWYMHGIKSDGSGGHAWWGNTNASARISENIKSSADVKVSFGSDCNGHQNHAIIVGNNGYSYDNISNDLAKRMKRINNRRKTIDFIRLFGNDEYFISDSEGTEWILSDNVHLGRELKKQGKIHDVAVARNGCWIVIKKNTYECSVGISNQLTKKLNKFYQLQRERADAQQIKLNEYRRIQQAIEAQRISLQEEVERSRVEEQRLALEAARRYAEQRRAEEAARKAVEDEQRRLQVLRKQHAEIQDLESQLASKKRQFQLDYQALPPNKRFLASTEEQLVVDDTCVVCQDVAAESVVVPCGHQCLCEACSRNWTQGSSTQCPICRSIVQTVVKVFR